MASWYTEGTVTVTNGSAVVTGAGTKFSNCRSGDMFVGPDSAIYQVINPSSDTAVSISPVYRGATAAGAAYGVVPVNGYPKALADAVNQMVQQWGSTLAGLGTVSTFNTVPVANGGTGATNAASARTNLGLGAAAVAAIVGTVSQASGAPTGAIIERGTNANGDYTKFADGTLICSIKSFSVTYAAATYLAANWTYPAAYSAQPQVFASQVAVVSAFKFNRGVPGASGDTAYAAVRVFATGTDAYSSGESTAVQVYSIGRWF